LSYASEKPAKTPKIENGRPHLWKIGRKLNLNI